MLETLPEGQTCRKLGPSVSHVTVLGEQLPVPDVSIGVVVGAVLRPPFPSLPARVTLISPGLAFLMFQRAPSPSAVSAPSHLDASDDLDDLDVLRTRHARHSRK